MSVTDLDPRSPGLAAGNGETVGDPADGGRRGRRPVRRAARRARRREPRRHRRLWRIILGCLLVVVLALVAGGGYLYLRLSRNITALPLYSGVSAPKPPAAPAGHGGAAPLNLLVIGSDARSDHDDCRLGGGCRRGVWTDEEAQADVEMVVHLAADRSHATVMSIPRDTMTQLPGCVDPGTGQRSLAHRGQINSALNHGPGCQVAAVQELTGIPIDHFVMVDFSGVVTMADAAGGAEICVSDDVYDSYSHLKLSAGSHVVSGVAALQFVRSRHAFGDGSDLGRAATQHLYLSAVMRAVRSAGTLTDPARLYRLADAATRALTVDTDLGSLSALTGLAAELSRVPTRRITFTTMQTGPDPSDPNRVVPGPRAAALFEAIANDLPLSSASPPSATPSPSPRPTASPGSSAGPSPDRAGRAAVSVRILNGSGVSGRGTALAAQLVGAGFTRAVAGSASRTEVTELSYSPAAEARARELAASLGLPAQRLHEVGGTGRPRITLTVGADWPSGATYGQGGDAAADEAAVAARALDGAGARTADDTTGCAAVSRYATVEVDGIRMTPTRAYSYADRKGTPDSAP